MTRSLPHMPTETNSGALAPSPRSPRTCHQLATTLRTSFASVNQNAASSAAAALAMILRASSIASENEPVELRASIAIA